MFEATKNFILSLIGKKAVETQPQNSEIIVAQKWTEADVPASDMLGVIYEGIWLRELTNDKKPSRPLNPSESYWTISANDLNIPIQLPGTTESNFVRTKASIRFEPEMGLGKLLENRERITLTELTDIIQSRFAGLVEMVSMAPEILIHLNSDEIESLRAKFSLLLSSDGIRCVNLEPITQEEQPVVAVKESSESQIIETDSADKKESLSSAAETEIKEEIEKVQSKIEWDKLARRLTDYTPQIKDEIKENLEEKGYDWLDKKTTSSQMAADIVKLAQEKMVSVLNKNKENSYWNGIALRMRLFNEPVIPNDVIDNSVSEEHAEIVMPKSERTKGGFFTSQVKLDSQLREFLAVKVASIQSKIRTQQNGSKDIKQIIKLREISQRISTVQDMISTLPELTAKTSDFQIDKSRVKGFVDEINRTITAAEYIDAAISTPYLFNKSNLINELEKSIEVLISSLRIRYNIRKEQ